MHAPDWERYKVAAAGGVHAVGDPTRWGVQAFTRVIGNQDTFSNTIASISTRDNYARPWSILGTLTLPRDVFGLQQSMIALECTMGVGQVQILQNIVLLFGFDGPPPSSSVVGRKGLCATQSVFNGGPYWESLEPTKSESIPNGPPDICLPFAAVGALVGQSISIRVRYAVGPAAPLPTTSRLALIVTPYAAGEGL